MAAKRFIKFPYENLSLVNLPGEKWKTIPDFEGLYKMSNYGRIKAVARHAFSRWGTPFLKAERIIKGHLLKKHNKTLDESTYTLNITLFRDGIRHNISIARYVYWLFIGKFDLGNKHIFISFKDHDGRNVHVSNLYKAGMQAIKLASYKDGRAVSHLKKLSKPVTQFDPEGNPIQSFPSMYEAGKMLGIGGRNIAEVVNGPGNMYKGFFWKLGVHKRKLNLRKLLFSGKQRPEINHSLRKRLRVRNFDEKNPPAYLNLSTKSIKGEKWKAIPGYEGLYEVSNHGRVKALQKVTQGGKRAWMPEQIKMLTVDFRLNEKGKEVPGSTLVTLAKDGKKKTVSIPRFVYYLFVKKFKISDSTLRVYYKDGNSLNCHYKNLILKSGVWSFTNLRKTL